MPTEQERPWNICDDFFDPLVGCLEDFKIEYDDRGKPTHWAYEENGIQKLEYQIQVAHLTALLGFAVVWLQVNVSDSVARTLAKTVERIEDAVSHNNDLEVASQRHYLEELSIVLRERQGTAIQKSDIPREVWRGPFKAAELYHGKNARGKLGVSKSQFYRLKDKHPESIKKTANGYQVRRELFPESPTESH